MVRRGCALVVLLLLLLPATRSFAELSLIEVTFNFTVEASETAGIGALSFGRPNIRGALPRELVQRLLEKRREALKACYQGPYPLSLQVRFVVTGCTLLISGTKVTRMLPWSDGESSSDEEIVSDVGAETVEVDERLAACLSAALESRP
ncbi:MAG: hypothetical protein AUK47_16225 [Deltaproteobacteria bacterium CG2_30_63_29]|nr:MAG: hypothetical protein AUK47_16225 [Deltaproteobacteria bacterium CG2_30_63_29]PJB48297.1 MAG: hypothetical protein CO108_02615 [Deltaproteobacteria bacterium CG_4_9_14_3_um_filter_63_12]